MKKIFSGKLVILLISAGILAGGIALACASDWEVEYGTSNFTPEVFVKDNVSPFFYSNMFYYKMGHDENQNVRFNKENVKDWSGYLNHEIPAKELEFFLQNASLSTIDSASLFMSGKSTSWPSSMNGFTMEEKVKSTKAVAFIKYLRLAKISETFACSDIEFAWNIDTTKKIKKYIAEPLNEELKKGFMQSRDIFLKQRFWFQLERSYFYNNNFKDLVDGFERNEKTMPRNTLYWRTLSYVAGAYNKKKQFAKANYYYSLVYDYCDLLKTSSHYSFHPQEEKDWKETIALCSNTEEQSTLWQMLGVFYSDEMRSIREIYQLNPGSPKLDLLLARAVNKYEQKFDAGNADNGMPPNPGAPYEDSLKQLIDHIAEAGNTDKPWIWNMAAGYLNTLDGAYSKALPYFDLAGKTLPAEKLAREQLRLLKFINRLSSAKVIDNPFEQSVLNDLQWIKSFGESDTSVFRTGEAMKWMKETFASHYSKQQEWAKSECFISHTSFYSEANHVQLMKSFLSKSSKTAFEQFCFSLAPIQLEDIFEFEAIQLAYKDSLDAAIEKMGMAGAHSEMILAGNPFNARINDCHDCDFAAPQKIKYSKLSFLKKMKELEDKVAKENDVLTNASLLANAFYNMSQYGNARLFYESKILGDTHYAPVAIGVNYRSMLLNMDLSVKYYNLAFKAAKTDEQKAKCQYLLAKCERNEWYTNNLFNKRDQDKYVDFPRVDLNALDGFKVLKQYPDTRYYKEVLKECGYFKSYLKW